MPEIFLWEELHQKDSAYQNTRCKQLPVITKFGCFINNTYHIKKLSQNASETTVLFKFLF